MKQLSLFLVLLLSSITGFSQTSIKLEDVSKHIGDSVTVCGKAAGGRYLDGFDGSPTFLNLGAAYPDQLLTLERCKRPFRESTRGIIQRSRSLCNGKDYPF